MIQPYDPQKHRVPSPAPKDPPLWKQTLLVFVLFGAGPLVIAGLIEVAARHFVLAILVVVFVLGGLYYGIRNVDALEEIDEET